MLNTANGAMSIRLKTFFMSAMSATRTSTPVMAAVGI